MRAGGLFGFLEFGVPRLFLVVLGFGGCVDAVAVLDACLVVMLGGVVGSVCLDCWASCGVGAI